LAIQINAEPARDVDRLVDETIEEVGGQFLARFLFSGRANAIERLVIASVHRAKPFTHYELGLFEGHIGRQERAPSRPEPPAS
jgi:hypothetical protein